MIRATVLAVTVALAVASTGCPAATTVEPEQPAVDPRVATRGARDLVKELYDNVRRGGTDGLLPLVDPAMVTVGPGAADIFTERSAALVAFAAALPPGEKYKVVSTDLRIMLSPGGHAAWASDVVVLDGKRYSLGIVMTEADELWTIAAVQIGVPTTRKELAGRKDVAAPTPVPAPADPAKPLALLFKASAADPLALQDQLMNRPDTVVRDIAGRSLIGKKAIKKAWKKEMKGVVTAPRDEALYARVTPDGTLGWVIGAVDVTVKKAPTVPTRMLHIYEKTADGWEVVLAQPAVMPGR